MPSWLHSITDPVRGKPRPERGGRATPTAQPFYDFAVGHNHADLRQGMAEVTPGEIQAADRPSA
ncbi:hypothetical protein [uncultured Thermosynechococcus sp.]|uniref:hypothetical protein n=1 Tax=uncultured Thermosynechococcus sp. TaxID=436945 RepID=UPI0026128901|nr:hypothetical protein [uncultured Thermosynechococcus sp.]